MSLKTGVRLLIDDVHETMSPVLEDILHKLKNKMDDTKVIKID